MAFSRNRTVLILPVMVLASVPPIAFPAAQMGYAGLQSLGLYAIIPSGALLLAAALASRWKGRRDITSLIINGTIAGAAATLALEAVRYPGFRLGFMPGNLPRLMGVLLLDRFAHGPSLASDLVGFAYHFWNGASFGIIFAALAETGLARTRPLWGLGYGILIGIGFLASPVVESLGVGRFGVDFGWRFAATVLTAHASFGASLALLLHWVTSCRRRGSLDGQSVEHVPGRPPRPSAAPTDLP